MSIGHDCWKAALSWALVICQQVGKICTSGKFCHELGVGLVDGQQVLSSGTDNPRFQTLFGESMCQFMPRVCFIIDFMNIILISACADRVRGTT